MIDESVIQRIQSIYSTCSYDEQMVLRQILQEIVDTGDSETYRDVWLADFKEVPVSIEQFISDPYYLGESTDNGRQVYPFWRDTMVDIFNHGNQYNEVILSGATRIGKSATAVKIVAYMLYKLMLYRQPQKYFHLQPTAKMTIAFANLTKKLAEGVAFADFNQTLKHSPWFMEHGSMNRGTVNQIYVPDSGDIEIIAGSSATNFLGRTTFCLVGDTKILTSDGVKCISECVGEEQTVYQYISDEFVETNAIVACTNFVTETIRIELEDGTIIEGTPEHRVMLSDGTYKCLCDITSSDDLLTFNIVEEVDDMNFKSYDSVFKVYVHTVPNGKRYVGITSKSTKVRWGSDGSRYKNNRHFWNAIQKYGWDNITHEVIADGLNLVDACNMEKALISEYDTMNPKFGYNHTTGGNWSTPDEETRKRLSRSLSRRYNDPEFRKRMAKAQIGKHSGIPMREETKRKISAKLKGRVVSESTKEKLRGRPISDTTRVKLRNNWCNGKTKFTDPRLKRLSEIYKNREFSDEHRQHISEGKKRQYQNGYNPVWITDGVIERNIQYGEELPDGFRFGRLSVLDTYVYKGSVSKKICHDDVDTYLSDGWKLGRPSSVGENIRKSNQRMHWEYDGMRFDTAQSLADYLNVNGYTEIVDSTITSLSKRGFDKSPKYKSLHGKIVRVDHEDKINSEDQTF